VSVVCVRYVLLCFVCMCILCVCVCKSLHMCVINNLHACREYIKELRREVTINSCVTIAFGTGILMNSDVNLVAENGSHIQFTKHWAKY